MENYSLLCIVKFNKAQKKREKRLARLPPGGRVGVLSIASRSRHEFFKYIPFFIQINYILRKKT